jgi:hypothetical protein
MNVLTNRDIYKTYSSLPVVREHQQLPLITPDDARQHWGGILDLDQYNPEEGFIGFGVNLIHLTDAQLQILVQLEARAGEAPALLAVE